MFTGLVDHVGRIEQILCEDVGRTLRISCNFEDIKDGESIAVNGVCLTVRTKGENWFSCSAIRTTLDNTTIGDWREGQRVNLERAVSVGDRLGGHIVQGHVDSRALVRAAQVIEDMLVLDIQLSPELARLMVSRGSITLDGVSLTVSALLPDDGVQVSIIEYTRSHTTLGGIEAGHMVNVEADIIAKHLARLSAPYLSNKEI